MLEGISSNGKAANAASAYSTTQAIVIKIYNGTTLVTGSNQSLTPDNTGKFVSQTVTGLPLSVPLKVCVDSPSHLIRCTKPSGINARFTLHPVLVAGQTATVDLASDDLNHLKAGDIDNDNLINAQDSTLVISQYQAPNMPAGSFEKPTATGDAYDVNHDGVFNIQDIALFSINYTDFQIAGDQ
jgi:hypothetical protein